MDREFYDMVNSDVNRNKEIQKLTGVSPAQENWKENQERFKELQPSFEQRTVQHPPPSFPRHLWLKVFLRTLYWKMVDYCARMEAIKTSEYKRGYAAGRDYEFKFIFSQIEANVRKYIEDRAR